VRLNISRTLSLSYLPAACIFLGTELEFPEGPQQTGVKKGKYFEMKGQ